MAGKNKDYLAEGRLCKIANFQNIEHADGSLTGTQSVFYERHQPFWITNQQLVPLLSNTEVFCAVRSFAIKRMIQGPTVSVHFVTDSKDCKEQTCHWEPVQSNRDGSQIVNISQQYITVKEIKMWY